MPNIIEAGHAAGRDRASECILWRNASEVDAIPTIVNQAAWISARYGLGNAYARVVAEHAFSKGSLR